MPFRYPIAQMVIALTQNLGNPNSLHFLRENSKHQASGHMGGSTPVQVSVIRKEFKTYGVYLHKLFIQFNKLWHSLHLSVAPRHGIFTCNQDHSSLS